MRVLKWKMTQYFVQVLNVSPETSDSLFQVLSAVLWIGNLDFEDTDSEACRLTQRDRGIVQKIARLLGLEETQVMRVCTTRHITVKGMTTDIALKYHEVRQISSFLLCLQNFILYLHCECNTPSILMLSQYYRHVKTGMQWPRHSTHGHSLGW